VKSHLSFVVSTVVALALVLGLASAPQLIQAQNKGPSDSIQTEALVVAPGAIPIQGKLTNASGMPLNGTYNILFRLYDVETGGTALCSDTRPVVVQNGLFSDYMDGCYNGILNGQKVWLGVKVGADPEMTPRQLILPVPYALALVPGVSMIASNANPFAVQTSSSVGKALQGIASAESGVNYGVYGVSNSGAGTGGYFYNYSEGTGLSGISAAGTGVYAGSLGTALRANAGTGAAVSAEGTGIIRSTAKSYLWISGNDLRPYQAADTTVINMDTVGGAKIYSGATLGTRNVMLPITIMAPMYGQNVTISAVDIYWSTDSAFDGINVVLMRRQTGVCAGSSCYATLIDYRPGGGISCEDGVFPTGCTLHLVPTGNNVITSTSGILYLTFELNFTSSTTWIDIGGVRLTLEHD
jgi:hypothetical protein